MKSIEEECRWDLPGYFPLFSPPRNYTSIAPRNNDRLFKGLYLNLFGRAELYSLLINHNSGNMSTSIIILNRRGLPTRQISGENVHVYNYTYVYEGA